MKALGVIAAAIAAILTAVVLLSPSDRSKPIDGVPAAGDTSQSEEAGRSTAVESTITPAPERMGTSTAVGRESVPAAKLIAAYSASEAFRQLEEEFGLDDYRVLSLAVMIQGLCSGEMDPNAVLQSPVPDPSREWAITSLIEYCDGFSLDPTSLPRSRNAPDSVISVARAHGEEAAIKYARDVLATDSDIMQLAEAALYLLETGQTPRLSTLGPLDDAFGFQDQQNMMIHASHLGICDMSGGCGSNTPFTLGYCIEAGCIPGSDYWSALRQNLSPGELSLVQHYYAWLRHFRR